MADEKTYECPCCGGPTNRDGFRRVIRKLRKMAEAAETPEKANALNAIAYKAAVEAGEDPHAEVIDLAGEPLTRESFGRTFDPDGSLGLFVDDEAIQTPDRWAKLRMAGLSDRPGALPALPDGFAWKHIEEDYVVLLYKGSTCYGSQVRLGDAEGIERVMNAHVLPARAEDLDWGEE
jgi:hypothetical protein